MNQNVLTKRTTSVVLFFYLLIAFEFFYMASPFAVYFYTIYKPGLRFLNNLPGIAGLTGFFMPHIVESTKSLLLNSIKTIGIFIALIGFVVFAICAFQVYYSKLFKRGMVSGGLYKSIRHPQYTAFAVCGFGLLLIWPRYLTLMMYVTLLFAYFLLARMEEKECTSRFGQSYLTYKLKTYMFLPVNFKKLFPGKIHFDRKHKVLLLISLYLIIITSSLMVARQIKKIAIRKLYTIVQNNHQYLSVTRKSKSDIFKITSIVQSDSISNAMLNDKITTDSKVIGYILPADLFISEIPMDTPDSTSCHIYNNDYGNSVYKVIFTEVITRKNKKMKEKNYLIEGLNLKPLIEVWINISTGIILKRMELSLADLKYGNIPEPLF